MEDQSLINKIQSLKEIKPSQEWQVQTELKILGYKPKAWDRFSLPQVNFVQPRYAFAFGMLFIVLMSTLAFGVNRQDQITKYGYAGLTNNLDKSSSFYLDYAAKNLALIKSGKATNTSEIVSGVKLALEKAQAKLPTQISGTKESSKLVSKINNVQEQLDEVRAVIGEDIAGIDAEMNNVKQSTQIIIEKEIYRLTAGNEIELLKDSSLTDEQLVLFQEAQTLYNIGRYQESLEKILELSNMIKN